MVEAESAEYITGTDPKKVKYVPIAQAVRDYQRELNRRADFGISCREQTVANGSIAKRIRLEIANTQLDGVENIDDQFENQTNRDFNKTLDRYIIKYEDRTDVSDLGSLYQLSCKRPKKGFLSEMSFVN